jgi:hypothetical protein
MSERIYAVYHGASGRLIRAKSRAQALSHAAQSAFNIHVAGQEELVTLLGQNVKVESVREPDQNELDLDTQ